MNHVIRRHQSSVEVFLPVVTKSETNMREHWSSRHRRRKGQRELAAFALVADARRMGLPVQVTLTRIAPRKLDDDNLRGALKAIRDGVADAFGVDDGSEMVAWEYGQRSGKRADCGVEVGLKTRLVAGTTPSQPSVVRARPGAKTP